jgi:DNA-binding CsgD family transcriptional regulator/catechol 2,3-dioxygenase-like lactoylglutathione lyase family enzyme
MKPGNRRGRPRHDDILTPAEWRTVRGAQHGMSNSEIARRQNVSVNAVKFHIANALSKLNLKNKPAIRKWFAAPKESALNKNPPKQDTDLSLGPIGQISRTVSDIAESVEWYGSVLGLPRLYTFGELAFFDCGGTRLFLTQTDEVSQNESIIYLRVDDIASAHETLASRGVEFTNAPHMVHKHEDGTEEWMAFFKDPDGRPLALMSQVGQ